MGGLCSKSNGVEEIDLDTSRHNVGANKLSRGSMVKKANESTKSVEDVFFDAFQSFSDLGNLNYPPASQQYKPRSSTICIDLHESLLRPNRPTTSDTEEVHHNPPSPEPSQRDSTIEVKRSLIEGKNTSSIAYAQGYPGELNDNELNACLQFREKLKQLDPAYLEMVRAYSPAEGEAFALCRFLRARDFDADMVLNMLQENGATEIWKKAKRNNFYRSSNKDDATTAVASENKNLYNGCPVSVLMALFPIVVSGIAKNGATMFYLKPSFGPGGNMDMNGLECVISNLSDVIPYLWNLLHYRGIDSMIRETNCHDPEKITVLSERIIVVDLKGMPSALYDRGFMGECNEITNCFPETMNRTYMINVPMAFSVVWAIIKMFIEPRTLEKIGFFSYESKAKDDLLTYVDEDELLSNYGGNGPSFEDVMQRRQIEYENHKNRKSSSSTKRLIIETMMTYGSYRDSTFMFKLENDEMVSSIVIYSKGDSGADFTVKQEGNKRNEAIVIVETTDVSRSTETDKLHYSAKIFEESNSINNKPKIAGVSSTATSGKFTISAKGKGSGTEYYLVTIHVVSSTTV